MRKGIFFGKWHHFKGLSFYFLSSSEMYVHIFLVPAKIANSPNLYLHTKIPFGIFVGFDGLRTLGQFKDSTKVFQ